MSDRSYLRICLALVACCGCGRQEDGPVRGEEVAALPLPPEVPPPIRRDHPTRVVVHLEVQEREQRLADGVTYRFWTFGGQVPGRFIRVRQGDLVEFHLDNPPDSKMPHNIDLHAVNGPGGGAVSSMTGPGRTSTFSFTARNAGLFVYHCATAPVGMHIANGMYGLILVEPPGGLPPVDHEYYVMQGEVYTSGDFGAPGLQAFDMAKAIDERPPYVVFNGAVGALSGKRSLHAEAGQTVRLFVGNGGPNLSSSFHVIGEIFDTVHPEAGTMTTHNVQTTAIPPGGAAIVEFTVDVPGTYHLVDHAIFRAMNKGALAELEVTGAPDSTIYSGRTYEGVYLPEGGALQSMPAGQPVAEPKATTTAERIEFGRRQFEHTCIACHQADGRGLPHAFPPLAGSDYLNADRDRAIATVLHGRSGAITVNGQVFNAVMPALGLTDEQVANVLTYVYSQWGNNGTVVRPEDVAAVRAKGP